MSLADLLIGTHWLGHIKNLYGLYQPGPLCEFVIVDASVTSPKYDYRVLLLREQWAMEPAEYATSSVGQIWQTKISWLNDDEQIPIIVGSRWYHYKTKMIVEVTCTENGSLELINLKLGNPLTCPKGSDTLREYCRLQGE